MTGHLIRIDEGQPASKGAFAKIRTVLVHRQQVLFVVALRSVEQQLRPALEERYQVVVAAVRREALQTIEEGTPDLVLVDAPSIRFDIHRFFESFAGRPVATFILLGKDADADEMPRANGHLHYPISGHQLLRHLARIIPSGPRETVAWRGLRLDLENRYLIWEDQQVPITRTQADLALVFLESPDQMITREQLMKDVWGTDYMGDTRTLDVHIHWLRKALRQTEAPFVLQTQRRVGFRLTSS